MSFLFAIGAPARARDRPSSNRGLPGALLALALLLAGCTHASSVSSPGLAGSYAGTTSSGGAAELELVGQDLIAWGSGVADGRRFALAVLGPIGGPAAFAIEGEAPASGALEPSATGLDLTLPAPSEAVALERRGDARPAGGGLAGRWRGPGVELHLDAFGGPVAGRGRLEGRPIAVACAPAAAGILRCGWLLADGGLLRVRLEPRAGDRLRLRGLGGDLVLRRSGR